MTTPVFAKTVLAANTMTKIATVPTNIVFATVTLNIMNPSENVANAQIAIGNGDTPTAADYIDKGSIIPQRGGLLIRSCVLVPPGSNVFIRVDQDDVVANFSGLCQDLITP